MIGLVFIVAVSYLVPMASPHTIAVCNVVAVDGKSVQLFAATYHEWSEFATKSNNFGSGLSGGIILTDPNGNDVRYEFTSKALHNPTHAPTIAPTCGLAGSCDCDGGLIGSCSTDTAVWQAVTITNLVDGTYSVTTTTDDQIEWPSEPYCAPWNFTVQGSIATRTPTTQPTSAPSYSTSAPSYGTSYIQATPSPTSCVCSYYVPGNYTKSDLSGCVNENDECYGCVNSVCTCYETASCGAEVGALIDIIGGLTTSFIVIIGVSVVCVSCCMGFIIYCICAAVCCRGAKKGAEAQMGVITLQAASPNNGGQTQPTEIITATAI